MTSRIKIYKVKSSSFKGYMTERAFKALVEQMDGQDVHNHQCTDIEKLIGLKTDGDKPVYDYNHGYVHAPDVLDQFISIGPLSQFIKE